MNEKELPSKGLPSAVKSIPALPEFLRAVRSRTPARVFVGRPGSAYDTGTQLALRQDHASAVDAVQAELDLAHFEESFVRSWGLFQVSTAAASKAEYLIRPDLGRRLNQEARVAITQNCAARADLQVVIGDGLSAFAVIAQVPALLPLISNAASRLAWKLGQPFVVRYCRVGVMNDLGDLLEPQVLVLLIGERPGLATAESLSAYMAYRPRAGHTDADRNLVSNIHARGITPDVAARRIIALAQKMRQLETSGIRVKEDMPAADDSHPRLPHD